MFLCQICGRNEATVSYIPIFDKDKKPIYICENCEGFLKKDTRLQNYRRMDEKLNKIKEYREHMVFVANLRAKNKLLEEELKILKKKLFKCKDNDEIFEIRAKIRQIERELKEYIREIGE